RDAHRGTGRPVRDGHAIDESEGTDARHTIERRAAATRLRTRERDAFGVAHPVDVPLDRLDRVPHGRRRRVDDDRSLDLHCAARNAAAASDGSTTLTPTPVPISNPPITPRRGTMSIHHLNGPA